jgi:hypothetical protein
LSCRLLSDGGSAAKIEHANIHINTQTARKGRRESIVHEEEKMRLTKRKIP